jgi:diphosphomevalonate decarboxylase
MHPGRATAISCPNIAFIKYWGNRDSELRLPSNGSISMNLGGLHTTTQVTFNPALECDILFLNGKQSTGPALRRVSAHLDLVRKVAGTNTCAEVNSHNNFPTGAGIASSASAFAALSLAACAAAGSELKEKELSRLARRGSGSACRSIPGGFVEWRAGEGDEDSYAYSIAPPQHWALADCVAVVSRKHKPTSSTEGHARSGTSPLQLARIQQTPRHLADCRRAILEKDFARLAWIVELDSNLMHAVMMTSSPPVIYWDPGTLAVMQEVIAWRAAGLPVAYTIDAGPNVHVICHVEVLAETRQRLESIPGVEQVLVATPGGPARLLD